MNHPYTSLHMEARQAKQRLIQVLQDRRAESLVEIEYVPVANQQKRATDRPSLSRELTRQCKVLNLRKTERSAKESDWSGRDMSSFSFTLTLLLSGTIAAANADRPLFWLLIGPTPLAIGLAAAVVLRARFDLPACLLVLRKAVDWISS
jgi:hypothetical protein